MKRTDGSNVARRVLLVVAALALLLVGCSSSAVEESSSHTAAATTTSIDLACVPSPSSSEAAPLSERCQDQVFLAVLGREDPDLAEQLGITKAIGLGRGLCAFAAGPSASAPGLTYDDVLDAQSSNWGIGTPQTQAIFTAARTLCPAAIASILSLPPGATTVLLSLRVSGAGSFYVTFPDANGDTTSQTVTAPWTTQTAAGSGQPFKLTISANGDASAARGGCEILIGSRSIERKDIDGGTAQCTVAAVPDR